LQKCAGTRRVRSGRRRIDAQDDVDLLAIDLDALHQKADQLAALMPVQVRHPVVHATDGKRCNRTQIPALLRRALGDHTAKR
jgi:hypothetical protein